MDLTDVSLARRLAVLRWGRTGFRCPSCGHDRAWSLHHRPRVRTCERCRRQTSVTAGTILHRSRLPLRVWFSRAAWYDLGALPSSRGLADEHGIAPSSAWHLNQRFIAATLPPAHPPLFRALTVVRLRTRRAQPGPPLGPDAPSGLIEMLRRFRQRGRPPFQVTPTVWFSDGPVWVHEAVPTPEEAEKARQGKPSLASLLYPHRELDRWLAFQLERCLGTVSPRVVPRQVVYESRWALSS